MYVSWQYGCLRIFLFFGLIENRKVITFTHSALHGSIHKKKTFHLSSHTTPLHLKFKNDIAANMTPLTLLGIRNIVKSILLLHTILEIDRFSKKCGTPCISIQTNLMWPICNKHVYILYLRNVQHKSYLNVYRTDQNGIKYYA